MPRPKISPWGKTSVWSGLPRGGPSYAALTSRPRLSNRYDVSARFVLLICSDAPLPWLQRSEARSRALWSQDARVAAPS